MKPPSAASAPISSAPERPSGVKRDRGGTPCAASAPRAASRCARNSSPGRSARSLRTQDEVEHRDPPFAALRRPDRADPSSAAQSEIIGPAGSAMHRLPPTVAMFQILNEARNARQHWPISLRRDPGRGRLERVERRDRAGRRDGEAGSSTLSGSQSQPERSIRRLKRGCGSENSQVPPASQASPSANGPEVATASRASNRRDGVEVHSHPIDEPAGRREPAYRRCTLCAPIYLVIFRRSRCTRRSGRVGDRSPRSIERDRAAAARGSRSPRRPRRLES